MSNVSTGILNSFECVKFAPLKSQMVRKGSVDKFQIFERQIQEGFASAKIVSQIFLYNDKHFYTFL
jgi:hypothetical protein